VSLTVSDGSDSQSITIENYILVSTIPGQAAMPTGETFINTGIFPLTYEYETSGAENADTYIWELLPAEAGSVTGNGQTATVEFTDIWVGIATMKVKGVNDCGEGEFSESLEIECDFEYTTNENVLNEISIFPNPTTDNINIDFGKLAGQEFDVSILNSLGEIVVKEFVITESYQASLENNAPGVYYIAISGKDVRIFEKLILK
jgi:hypothetical protein